MISFIELTHEDGHRIILNTDEIIQVAPLGGDERRGCAVTLLRRGPEPQSRHVRVREPIETISNALKPVKGRSAPEGRPGLARFTRRPAA